MYDDYLANPFLSMFWWPDLASTWPAMTAGNGPPVRRRPWRLTWRSGGAHRHPAGVCGRGRGIAEKNKEYEPLLFLISNADIVFSKETLYERIRAATPWGTATVAVHINRLGKKY